MLKMIDSSVSKLLNIRGSWQNNVCVEHKDYMETDGWKIVIDHFFFFFNMVDRENVVNLALRLCNVV